MYNLTEKNARSNRHLAVVVTIGLHIALAAGLYLTAGEKPAPKKFSSQPKTEKATVSTVKNTPVDRP